MTSLPYRRSRSRLPRFVLPVIAMAVCIGLWWLATIIFHINSFLLPSPADIVRSFLDTPGYLLRETGNTLLETLYGYAIAAVGGLFVAMLLTASKAMQRAILPILVGFNAVPKIAVAPLLVVWMGFGQSPKVVMVVLIAFFPIVVSSMAGLSSTPADLGELARSLSASRRQTFLKVRLPWALPQVFVGLKVAIALAVIGAVVGEFSGGNTGLGYVIVASGSSADTSLAFAAIALLAIISIGLFYLVAALEHVLLPWVRETSA